MGAEVGGDRAGDAEEEPACPAGGFAVVLADGAEPGARV